MDNISVTIMGQLQTCHPLKTMIPFHYSGVFETAKIKGDVGYDHIFRIMLM